MGDVIVQAAIMTAGFYFAPMTAPTLMQTARFFAVAVAIAGANYYMQQQAMRNNFANKSSGRMVTQRNPIGLRQVIYGTVRVGGNVVFMETTSGTNDDNAFLHMIIAFAGHEVNSIGQIYFDDHALQLDANGDTASTDSKYYQNSSHVRVIKKLGTTTQTAVTELVNESDNKWTNSHTLKGIAYIYVKLAHNNDIFPNGIPNITALIQGKKVFDPRNNTTAFSDNPALCIRDYLTNSDYGLDTPANQIDNATVIATANLCDETVTLADSSTEKRYTANGSFDTGEKPNDIINELSTSMGGQVSYSSGKFFIIGAEYKTPVKTFTEADLTSGITVTTRKSRRDQYNGIKGVFADPDNLYQPTDFPSYQSSTFLSEDQNRENYKDVTFPFTTSHTMAQRLAKIDLFRSRNQISANLKLTMKAFDVRVGDTIYVTNTRLGWTNKIFEVVTWKLSVDANGKIGVECDVKETTSGVYTFSSSEERSKIVAPATSLIDQWTATPITGLALSEQNPIAEDGTSSKQIKVTWTVPANAYSQDRYIVRVKLSSAADSDYVYNETTENFYVLSNLPSALTPFNPTTGINTDGQYTVGVASINNAGVISSYVSSTITLQGIGSYSQQVTMTATGGKQKVILNLNIPNSQSFLIARRFSYVEIWRATTNDRANASLVGRSYDNVFIDDELLSTTTYYYWTRAVDKFGNASTYYPHQTGGISATTLRNLADEIADGIVTTAKFAQTIKTIEVVSSLPSSGASQGDVVFLTSDNKLYRYTGSAWTKEISGTDITDDSISTSKIQADAITAGKISTGAVGADEIAANAINADKIASNAVTADKIAANSVDAGNISVSSLSSISNILGDISSGGSLSCTGRGSTNGGIQLGLLSGTTSVPMINMLAQATYVNIQSAILQRNSKAENTHGTVAFLSQSTGQNGTKHSIRAQNTTAGTSVVCGADSSAYDVVADGKGRMFASNGFQTFTGAHLAFVLKTQTLNIGDIVVDDVVKIRESINTVITSIQQSTTSNDKKAVGIYTGDRFTYNEMEIITGFLESLPMNEVLALSQYDCIMMNSLGEGQVNVCGENGNIEKGDLITTSNTTGKGMKQADDIIRNYTVAKAREDVTFSSASDTAMIGCIYLCG